VVRGAGRWKTPIHSSKLSYKVGLIQRHCMVKSGVQRWSIGVGVVGWRQLGGVRIDASRGGAQCGVLERWWAGWPASPPMSLRMREFWGRFWAAPTPIRAKWGCELPARRVVMLRAATKDCGGDARCHQGSYRGRGCPESPHFAMHLPPASWRCRPARPPTPQNTPLRAAPRCADSHPDDRPLTADSHPIAPTKTAAPHPSAAPPRSFPTLMIPQKSPISNLLRS
jgi:hypothetical protein